MEHSGHQTFAINRFNRRDAEYFQRGRRVVGDFDAFGGAVDFRYSLFLDWD
jgi:hypothetical protein